MDWVLLGIPVGIVMLYFGSDWLVKGAKGLALRLGISAFVVGLTVVAFGSSAPECVTSLVSSETPEIIIGNVVGSNIVNIGLAIGLAAMISPLAAKYLSMRFEVIMMMVAVSTAALERALQIGAARHVRITLCAGDNLNPCLRKRRLCAAASPRACCEPVLFFCAVGEKIRRCWTYRVRRGRLWSVRFWDWRPVLLPR